MIKAQDLLLIERSIVLHAPRARVWRALTDEAQFASWFRVTLSGEFEPGGRATLRVDEPGYQGIDFPLYVQSKEPESVFSWRWVPGDAYRHAPDESQMTLVTFTLEEVEEGTRLTVVESGFDSIDLAVRAQALSSNTEGWAAQLINLEAHVGSAS